MRIIAPMIILMILTASIAGCSGDDDSRVSKEELVQLIRDGNSDGDFSGVDLSSSDLSGLQNMELFGDDFTGADLSFVDFTDSDLRYVNFTGASLSNVKFVNSNLEWAKWSDTICPDGTNSDDNDNTCENNLADSDGDGSGDNAD